MDTVDKLLVGVAVASLASTGAVLLGVVPSSVLVRVQGLSDVLTALFATAVVGLLFVLLFYMLNHAKQTDGESDQADQSPRADIPSWGTQIQEPSPEAVDAGERRPLGLSVTLAAGEDDPLAETFRSAHVDYERIARDRLQQAVTKTLVRTTDADPEAANRRVERGTWTDDRHAASYLATGRTPTLPPAVRLRDWLAGERTARCVRATVRELRSLSAESQKRQSEPDHGRERRSLTAEAGSDVTDTREEVVSR